MENRETLFLHWGPGGNAAMERLWFGDQLPFDWWDQPVAFANAGGELSELFDAATTRLEMLASRQGGAVPVVAHCFGARIATELARRMPHRIQSLTLLSCSTRPTRGFVRLAEKLVQKSPDESLEARIRAARAAFGPGTFWPLFEAITSRPDFIEPYWGDPKHLARYLELAPRAGAPVHPAAFQALMNGLLAEDALQDEEPAAIAEARAIPVVCLIGSADPLVSAETESRAWRRLFPQAQVVTVPGSGHFVHLETPSSVWAPDAAKS